MRVLIGYLINGKSSGIDKYVLRDAGYVERSGHSVWTV